MKNPNKLNIVFLFLLVPVILFTSCTEKPDTLPILGYKKVKDNGEIVYHTIPEFRFINQDSNYVTNETYKKKIYVADFFFTSCPSICPMMSAQMLRIYEKYKENDKVMLLSYTVDPARDSVPVLKRYAGKLGVSSEKWSFVTGDRAEIYDIADEYFSVAVKDSTVEGGYNHSGRLILVDWEGRIRAYCDGTEPQDVNGLMEDIDILLREYKKTHKDEVVNKS